MHQYQPKLHDLVVPLADTHRPVHPLVHTPDILSAVETGS